MLTLIQLYQNAPTFSQFPQKVWRIYSHVSWPILKRALYKTKNCMKASQWLHTDLMNLSCNNLRNHFSRGSSCQFPFLLPHSSHPLLILQYASLQHSSIHTFIRSYIHSYLHPSIHARMLNRSSKHAYRDDNYFQRSHLHFLCTSPRHNTRNTASFQDAACCTTHSMYIVVLSRR